MKWKKEIKGGTEMKKPDRKMDGLAIAQNLYGTLETETDSNIASRSVKFNSLKKQATAAGLRIARLSREVSHENWEEFIKLYCHYQSLFFPFHDEFRKSFVEGVNENE